MAPGRSIGEPQLAFDALTIEGGLLGAEWLGKVAQLEAPAQEPADYRVPKGLHIRDEIARSWRIAEACWKELEAGRSSGGDGRALAERFVEAILREALGFASLARAEPRTIGERVYPVQFFALGDRVPIVVAPAGAGLDTPLPELGDGRRRRSAFGLLQEYLNASPAAVWGLVCDGARLRIARDNASLTRPAWIEADLARIFGEERFSDFAALFLLAHESRFGRPEDPSASCPLEAWREAGRQEGTRARDKLRTGFEQALEVLGQGFLSHAANAKLRAALHAGELTKDRYFGQLLRLVYRLIFLLAAEERNLLHPKGTSDAARRLYEGGYALRRLRDRAIRRSAHDRHVDLWEGVKIVFRGLATGEPRLGLPALAGLFAPEQCPDLDQSKLENRVLLGALFHLAWLRERTGLVRVNWRDMGPDELGYVYEGLLELVPQITESGRSFSFAQEGESRGHARKTTGSYYTPDELVQLLLQSALDPVIERVVSGQWRVARGEFETEQEREEAYEIVSRARGVEAGDDGCRAGISSDSEFPQGGTVRDDLAGSASRDVDSGEHRRGMGAAGRPGVLAVSPGSQREPARAGNASAAQRPGSTDTAGERPTSPFRAGNPLQAAPLVAKEASSLTREDAWILTPLATRHSLLASEALLRLSIVDPACGSGHFLLAAARRLADHVARLSAGAAPTPDDYQHALRDVVRRCIYGVDMNPLAVELCKVSLWMESIDPGLPLTFLESHIRCGNSLLGTTRALMGDAVPDEAWAVLEGDDKKVTASLKRRNKEELAGQLPLRYSPLATGHSLGEAMQAVEEAPDTDAVSLAEKERKWKELCASQAYEHEKLVADAWCAAFLWPKVASGKWRVASGEEIDARDLAEAAPTTAVWRSLREGSASRHLLLATRHLANQYGLFHWELAFPHVFARGGFDVVLGNPPWERVKLQEQEFFASREPSIAKAKNAAERKRLIAALPSTNPELWREWTEATRVAEGQSHFVRESGRYPLCGKGDVNTYALFAEHNWRVLGPHGRAGFIVPSGIATDDTTKEYFQALLDRSALASIYHFENEDLVFKGLHHAYRFVLMTVGQAEQADLVFYARRVVDLSNEQRHFALDPGDFATLNPNTRTCPTFRSRRDADLNLAIYRRTGVLWREGDPDGNPWGLRFMAMFHMTNDSGLFRTRAELEAAGWKLQGNRFVNDGHVMLPLYEAKMIHHFDHRFGTYEGQNEAQANQGKLPELDDAAHADPRRITLPRYWVAQPEVEARLSAVWDRGWLLGWRDICRATDERTVIASLIPRAAVGDKFLLMMPSVAPPLVACLAACLSSFALDYAARQKVGGTSLKYFTMRQFPVLAPAAYLADTPWQRGTWLRDWILPRVLELSYTAWDLKPFAEDCGDDGPPYLWDAERRAMLRAELDAAFFHLYGLSREEAGYVMDTFPIVRRHDETAHGEYRTKRVILETYDALARATATGQPYASPLPPPRRAR